MNQINANTSSAVVTTTTVINTRLTVTAIANRTRLMMSIVMGNGMLCGGIKFGTDAIGTKNMMTLLNYDRYVIYGVTTITRTVMIFQFVQGLTNVIHNTDIIL